MLKLLSDRSYPVDEGPDPNNASLRSRCREVACSGAREHPGEACAPRLCAAGDGDRRRLAGRGRTFSPPNRPDCPLCRRSSRRELASDALNLGDGWRDALDLGDGRRDALDLDDGRRDARPRRRARPQIGRTI